MVPKSDQKKIKGLLKETITLLCKNGLAFKDSVSVEALIGVTVDEKDVFLVSLNEIVEAGNEPKSKRRPSDESDEEESSKSELNRKGKQKRKRGSRSSSGEESADEMPEVKHKKTPVEIRTPKAVVTPKEVVTPKQVKTPTRTATPNQAKVPAKSVKTPQIQPEGHPKPLTQPQPQTELNMSCEMVDQDGNVDLSAVTVKEEVLEDWAVMLEKESSTVSSAADNDIPIPSTSAVEDPSVSQLGEMDHSADEMCEEPSTSEGPVTTHSQSSPSKILNMVGQKLPTNITSLYFQECLRKAGAVKPTVDTRETPARLRGILRKRNMREIRPRTPKDGNCFFHAILALYSRVVPGSDKITAMDLRTSVCNFLANGGLNALSEEASNEVREAGGLDQYIDNMSQNGTWADHIVVAATALLLGINIQLISSRGLDTIFQPPEETLEEGQARLQLTLGYLTDQHFFAVEDGYESGSTEEMDESVSGNWPVLKLAIRGQRCVGQKTVSGGWAEQRKKDKNRMEAQLCRLMKSMHNQRERLVKDFRREFVFITIRRNTVHTDMHIIEGWGQMLERVKRGKCPVRPKFLLDPKTRIRKVDGTSPHTPGKTPPIVGSERSAILRMMKLDVEESEPVALPLPALYHESDSEDDDHVSNLVVRQQRVGQRTASKDIFERRKKDRNRIESQLCRLFKSVRRNHDRLAKEFRREFVFCTVRRNSIRSDSYTIEGWGDMFERLMSGLSPVSSEVILNPKTRIQNMAEIISASHPTPEKAAGGGSANNMTKEQDQSHRDSVEQEEEEEESNEDSHP